MIYTFPEDFLFGTASAAAQIETPVGHDWENVKIFGGGRFTRAIDHELHRMDDAKIIASLGNAHRFSFDWAKLQTSPRSQLVPSVVEDYRNFMGALKDRGLHNMLTLHHFASPNWFVKEGGWTNLESVLNLADYARRVTIDFGDLFDSCNPINEPDTYLYFGCLTGEGPPHKPLNIPLAKRMLGYLSQAHVAAHDAIRQIRPDIPVGVAKNTMIWSPESRWGLANKLVESFYNFYMDTIMDRFAVGEFLGINYYGVIPWTPLPQTEAKRPGSIERLKRPHDDFWQLYPPGLIQVCQRYHERYPDKPIIITENGTCTDDDELRVDNLHQHLIAVHEAREMGMQITGYFVWTWADNNEWASGLKPHFGLYRVNPITMERCAKRSAAVYAKISRDKCFEYTPKAV